jgi:F0F1-type ATP synthase delta subunit
MKKNKKLDKIITQAVEASIKNGAIDQTKVTQFTKNFKSFSLEDAVYSLKKYQKGLQNFISQHTMTIFAATELPKETLTKIKNSYNSNSKLEIRNLKFELDSSLLAGFKFKIGDSVFDNSLRNSLENLKNQ